MKYSHQVVALATVFIMLGIILIGASQTINIPSAYSTFLGIPYAVNPNFVSSFNEMLGLLILGFTFSGFGFGILGTVGYVLKLERKLSQIPQPPPPPPQT
jgi:hypothetical protein